MFGILPYFNNEPRKVQERFVYDDEGRLAQSIDARGFATKYEYDPRGLVIRTTDALGGVVETRYNAAGQAAWVRDAMGRITTTDYDALGRPIAVHEYGVQPPGAVLATSATGTGVRPLRTSRMGYDARGNVVSTIEFLQTFTTDWQDGLSTTRYIYDDLDRQIAVVQPRALAFNAGASLVADNWAGANPASPLAASHVRATSRVFYNIDGTTARTMDAMRISTDYDYDRIGRMVRQENLAGWVTFKYNSFGQQFETENEHGITRTITSADLRERSEYWIEKNGTVELVGKYEYDKLGQLIRFTDGEENVTEYVYDELGRKAGEWFNAGHVTTASYNEQGEKIGETFGAASERRWAFFIYDASGNLTAKRDRAGRWTHYTYNSLGQPTDERWQAAVTANADYDLDGPFVHHVHYDYYPGGPLKDAWAKTLAPDGTWSVVSKLHRTYDGLGRPDVSTWDEGVANRTVAQLDEDFSDINNLRGDLRTSIGGNRDAEFYSGRDDSGRTTLVSLHAPDGARSSASLLYYANSQLAAIERTQFTAPPNSSVKRISATEFDYDSAGRLTNLKHAATKILNAYAFVYVDGRLEQSNSERVRVKYKYDADGQLQGESRQTKNDDKRWVGDQAGVFRNYDAAGNPDWAVTGSQNRLISRPDDPRVEQFSTFFRYDADGRLMRNERVKIISSQSEPELGVAAPDQGATYHRVAESAAPPAVTWALPAVTVANGTESYYLLVAWPVHANGPGEHLQVAYEVSGLGTGTGPQTFFLDQAETPLYRFGTRSYAALPIRLGAGQRTISVTASVVPLAEGETADRPRYLLLDDVALGKVESSTNYTWDHRGQLTAVTRANSAGQTTSRVDNFYDLLGHWAGQTVDSNGDGAADSERQFVYDQGHILYVLTDADGAGPAAKQLTSRLLWGPGTDQILAEQRREESSTGTEWVTYWAHPDVQGTPADWYAVRAEWGFQWWSPYDAFGNELQSAFGNKLLSGQANWALDANASYPTAPAGPQGLLIGWTGRPRDTTTGLQYNNARWYSPRLERFISPDSWGLAGGDTNFYRYGYNNPNQFSDPSGHVVESAWDVASITVGIGSVGLDIYHLFTTGEGWGDLGMDLFALALDVGAAALPFVPGGASIGVKLSRAERVAERAILAGRHVDTAFNAYQAYEGGLNAYAAYLQDDYWGAALGGLGAGLGGVHLGLRGVQGLRHFRRNYEFYRPPGVARGVYFNTGGFGDLTDFRIRQRMGDALKSMHVGDAGHHVPAVRKSKGRPFEVERTDLSRPTIHVIGDEAAVGQAHWRMHAAERTHIGPRQGGFVGSDAELFAAYRESYRDLTDIRVDVRSPDGSHILGTNVSLEEAVNLLEAFLTGRK